MVTETRNQQHVGRNDRALLWTLLAIIAIALLAYAAYAGFYRDNGSSIAQNNDQANVGTTTAPNANQPTQ